MPDNKNPNLALWDSMKEVDRSFTKPITGKSYKGDSPNPTYVIRKLTEALGPIGKRWGFNVKFDRVREGRPHQIITKQAKEYYPSSGDQPGAVQSQVVEYEIIRELNHEVCITFWFLQDGPTNDVLTFDCYGGTPMFYQTNSGKWINDEDAAKKSLTDAYTKGASWLGACADIFLGLFDDKYTGTPPEQPHGGNNNQPPSGDTQTPPPPSNGARNNSSPW